MRHILVTVSTLIATLALTACGGNQTESTTPIDAALDISLTSDAQALSRDLTAYQATNGSYPAVAAAQVAATTGTPLSPGNTVEVYTGTSFCLAHQPSGTWVLMNFTTNQTTTSGPRCGIVEAGTP